MRQENKHTQRRINLVVALIGTIALFIAILLLFLKGNATSYEVSIYSELKVFWIFIVVIQIIALLYFTYGLIFKKQTFKFVYFTIIAIDIIILLIPLLHGYYILGSGDVLTHIGWIKDIIRDGQIHSYYPAAHIIAVTLHYITDLDIPFLICIIPICFSIFFIFSQIILLRRIHGQGTNRSIFLIFPVLLIFQSMYFMFSPFTLSFFILPLILLLINFNSEKKAFYICSIVILSSIILWHPLTSIILIIILFFMFIINKQLKYKSNHYLTLAFLMLIFYTMWSAYLTITTENMYIAINGLFGIGASSEISTKTSMVSTYNLSVFIIFKYLFFTYGQYVFIGIISFYSIFHILNNKKTRKKIILSPTIFSSIIVFSIFVIATIITLFLGEIISFLRIFIIALVLSPIFILFFMNKIISYNKKKVSDFIKFGLIMTSLIIILIPSIFSLFYSPLMRYPNQQTTHAEYSGMETIFVIRNDNITIEEQGLSQDRFYDAIYGRDTNRTNIFYGNNVIPIDHFGYNYSSNYQTRDGKTSYFIINDIGYNYYSYIYPEFIQNARYNVTDYSQIKEDSTVNNVYSNGNIDLYFIMVD